MQVEKVIATHGGVVDKHECILLRGKLSIDQAEASMNNMCKDVRTRPETCGAMPYRCHDSCFPGLAVGVHR